MAEPEPRLVVFSTLFPHSGQPDAGLFVRERMFRVGEEVPLVVVAPVPWFPLQGLIRRFKPHYRPPAPRFEVQQGFEVYHPRFLSVPGLFKSLDGLFMALGAWPTLRRLRRRFSCNVIDAHFAYPDGYAAGLLGKWLGVAVTVTLRGTEVPLSRFRLRRRLIVKALARANRVFAVAEALKHHVVQLGADGDKIRVVGNGVDVVKFQPVDRHQARSALALPVDAPILVSVGGLVERKGFHRVIEVLPALRERFPGLRYLIVGGPSKEGDWRGHLQQLAAEKGVQPGVHFLGKWDAAELKIPLSAADCFVLATRNEGWANVFLEAMACGLPVVTTDVGGNREVVSRPDLGTLVPFGDAVALRDALAEALSRTWDRQAIRAHAEAHSWEGRVATLVQEFRALVHADGDARLAAEKTGRR